MCETQSKTLVTIEVSSEQADAVFMEVQNRLCLMHVESKVTVVRQFEVTP